MNNRKPSTDVHSKVVIYIQSLTIECSYDYKFNIYDHLNIKIPPRFIEDWDPSNPIPIFCEAECVLMSNNQQISPLITVRSNPMIKKNPTFPDISILHNVNRQHYNFFWDCGSILRDDNDALAIKHSIPFNVEFPIYYSEIPLDCTINITFYACFFLSPKQKIGVVTKRLFTKNSRRLKTGIYSLPFEDDIANADSKKDSNFSFVHQKNKKSIFRHIRRTDIGKCYSYEPYDESFRKVAEFLHPDDAVKYFSSLLNPLEPPVLSTFSKFIHISVPSPESNTQIIYNDLQFKPVCKDFSEDLFHFSKESTNRKKQRRLDYIKTIPPLSNIPSNYRTFLRHNIDTSLKDPSLYSALFRSIDWEDQAALNSFSTKLFKVDTVDIEYALEFFTDRFNFIPVRKYAVKCINYIARDQEKKKDILLYLPQIIQALKVDFSDGLDDILINLAKNDIIFATKLYWLSSFDDNKNIKKMINTLLNTLDEKSKHEIDKQIKLFDDIQEMLSIPKPNAPKQKKQDDIKALLSGKYSRLCLFPEPILSPLDPTIRFLGIDPQDVKVFASNKSPVALVFNAVDSDDQNKSNVKQIRMMFKIGDDIRQDQLILQLFEIMDKIFKASELDLCIKTYNILAISDRFGCMEFVENSQAIKDIDDNIVDEAIASDNLKKITNSIIETNVTNATFSTGSSTSKILIYLKRDSPTQEELKKRIETYTRSLAGFSVMTFVLIIGDRHDNNILVTQDGHFLHIDFGFIFGDDAKPLTQPVKIRAEYLLPINTDISVALSKVLNFAGPAFNAVRKHGRLILTLIELMFKTNISCIQNEKNPNAKLKSVQQSLMLNLTDIEAMKALRSTFIDSIKSKLTTLYDTIHNVAMMHK